MVILPVHNRILKESEPTYPDFAYLELRYPKEDILWNDDQLSIPKHHRE